MTNFNKKFRQFLTENKIDERIIYKTSEFGEIDNALEQISSALYVFKDEAIQQEIQSYLDKIQSLVDQHGTEEIE